MTKLINVHIHIYISWWEHFKSTQSSSIPHILWPTADAILYSRFPWTYSFHHYEILNALTSMCPTIPPPLPVHAMWLLHVREALWYLSSHDWLISLNIMSSSFIHEVTGNKVPSFFLNWVVIYCDLGFFFIHSSGYGHLLLYLETLTWTLECRHLFNTLLLFPLVISTEVGLIAGSNVLLETATA